MHEPYIVCGIKGIIQIVFYIYTLLFLTLSGIVLGWNVGMFIEWMDYNTKFIQQNNPYQLSAASKLPIFFVLGITKYLDFLIRKEPDPVWFCGKLTKHEFVFLPVIVFFETWFSFVL